MTRRSVESCTVFTAALISVDGSEQVVGQTQEATVLRSMQRSFDDRNLD